MLRTAGSVLIALLVLVACGEGPAPLDGGGADARACAGDAQCDDGNFCNGEETCASGACRLGTAPCMAGQRCDEMGDACITECAVQTDADGDGADAMECDGNDCDDSDAQRFPGNAEVCDSDGHDEDCDTTTIGDRDLDGDGLEDVSCCNGTTCGTDCNDLARGVSPGSPEVCNGIDDDCDGAIDEGARVTSWPDRDFDLHGDEDAPTEMQCAGAHGYATVGDDCDDTRPQVHTAQVEICDEIDNDCDATVDEAPAATTWYEDADDDGFGNPDPTRAQVSCTPLPGFSLRATDCNDAANGVSPAATEQCNGFDDDCNGRPDHMIAPGNGEDDDLDAQPDAACAGGSDCDDRDPTTLLGAAEICDRRDNDCDGTIDEESAMGIWYRDADGDTFGDDAMPTVMSCVFVPGHIPRGGDCDDSASARRPGTPEACNGIDDDCDEETDEGAPRGAYYIDADLDGIGTGAPILACTMPAGRVAAPGDCDDTSSSIRGPSSWWRDADGDGGGDRTMPAMLACVAPASHVGNTDDCDDGDPLIEVGAPERCNGEDDDCDGSPDDGASAACSLPNASAACTSGTCMVATCAIGFDDCDASDANGCELDVRTDRLNCGGCGTMCGTGELCRGGDCAGVAQLAGGQNFACARLTSGDLECWGSCGDGECGQGVLTMTRAAGPVLLYTSLPIDDATLIATHNEGAHACALLADRTVVCWGRNDRGQIGPDGGTRSALAVPIPGLTDIVHIGVGRNHSCAVRMDGTVWCWGENQYGALGSGALTPATISTPTQVRESDGAGGSRPITDAVEVSAGGAHTCVLHTGRTRVSCTGSDSYFGGWSGALGRGMAVSGYQPIAAPVALPAGTAPIVQWDTGTSHTCAIRASGRPICWGGSPNGQVTCTCQATTPREVALVLANATQVATTAQSSCFRYTHPSFGPRVACVGYDGSGELGDGTAGVGSEIPADVVTAMGGGSFLTDASEITMGDDFACAMSTSAGVVCWGSNGLDAFGYAPPPLSRPFADMTRPVPGVP